MLKKTIVFCVFTLVFCVFTLVFCIFTLVLCIFTLVLCKQYGHGLTERFYYFGSLKTRVSEGGI